MWTDTGNRLGADRSYYSTAADNAYNRDYGQWVDKGTMLNNDRTYYGNEYNNAYNRDYAEHTTQEGYKYQDVADANAYAQWEAEYNLAEAQANKTVAPTEPSLTAKEYNEVLANAEGYAAQGETALANYLNGLVARGLSPDEAADILEQYFPTKIPEPPKNGGRPGGSNGVVNVLN